MIRGERGARKSRRRFGYALPIGYLVGLWRGQEGRCFYTGEPMNMSLGTGHDPMCVSVDRVDPSKGYVAGNVVLCRGRVNSIKQDTTLDEMREWMPSWYQRVVDNLDALNAQVEARDDAPRNAAGRQVPTWMLDRRDAVTRALAVKEREGGAA